MPQEKQTTAVQYLFKEFSDILGKIDTTPMQDLLLVEAITKANIMFRQQIEDAYKAFYSPSSDKFGVAEYLKSKEYFESTFTQQQ
jgi:hypothetical protein